MVASPDGLQLYMVCPDNGLDKEQKESILLIYDTRNIELHKIQSSYQYKIPLSPPFAFSLAIHPNGKKLYIGHLGFDNQPGGISIFDVDQRKITKHISLDINESALVLTMDHHIADQVYALYITTEKRLLTLKLRSEELENNVINLSNMDFLTHTHVTYPLPSLACLPISSTNNYGTNSIIYISHDNFGDFLCYKRSVVYATTTAAANQVITQSDANTIGFFKSGQVESKELSEVTINYIKEQFDHLGKDWLVEQYSFEISQVNNVLTFELLVKKSHLTGTLLENHWNTIQHTFDVLSSIRSIKNIKYENHKVILNLKHPSDSAVIEKILKQTCFAYAYTHESSELNLQKTFS